MKIKVIELTNICKKYDLSSGIQKVAINSLNLTIYQGQRIGIYGENGAGKTTLLKIVGGITKPSEGRLYVHGKINTIVNISGGFLPDLSGVDNIIIQGVMMGLSRQQISNKIPSIIDNSGINRYATEPFYTYSTGMKFRLAFSIALATECDILAIDEVFLAGDIEFQQQSAKIIKNLQKNRHFTTIICSHSPSYLYNFADTYYELIEGTLHARSVEQVKSEINRTRKLWNQTYIG